MENKKYAFSLIELSIVILVIGILIAGIIGAQNLIIKSRLFSTRAITKSSPVIGIKDLSLWLETTSDKSFLSDYTNNDAIAAASGAKVWLDLNNQSITKNHALSTSSYPHASNPAYFENGINSLPSLKFDGSYDYLNLTNTSLLNNTSYTIFVVEKSTKATGKTNYWLAPKAATSCSANTCFNMGHENLTSGTYTIYMSHFANFLATTSTQISGLAYKNNIPILHSGFFSTAGSRKYFYNGNCRKN